MAGWRAAIFALVLPQAMYAQTAPKFEVASVKAAAIGFFRIQAGESGRLCVRRTT